MLYVYIVMNDKQNPRINDVLYHLHRDIAAPLPAKKLAHIAAYSEQHFHRVFKQVVGESVNRYIRRTRLEHAANQLMFDTENSILTIAEKCGFMSLSSFNQVFKAHFNMTPGQWRRKEVKPAHSPYLTEPEMIRGAAHVKNTELPKPSIVELPNQYAVYVRHKGYGRSITKAWSLLKAWAIQQGVYDDLSQIGLHHSNPAWVSLPECRYVACLAIDKPMPKQSTVDQLIIPGGLHVAFRLQGQYGELLPWLSRILEDWLPTSGYRLQTTPLIVHYLKNHFLSEDEKFDVKLYLPISLA